jgi:hypothetical protein
MSVGVKTMKTRVRSKIDDYLQSRGTSKAWLSRQIGATPAQVNNWCKNDKNGYAVSQPSVGYVLRMIKVLDCSIYDLWDQIEE